VLDSLSLVESLLGGDQREPEILIHPRCEHVIAGFYGYERASRSGEFLDTPLDPQHPHEEMIDCVRGAACDKWPEGRRPAPKWHRVSARKLI
jgi:hypothetical protein